MWKSRTHIVFNLKLNLCPENLNSVSFEISVYRQAKKTVISPFFQELEKGHRRTEQSQEPLTSMLGCPTVGEPVFTWRVFTLWTCWPSSNVEEQLKEVAFNFKEAAENKGLRGKA